MSGWKEVLNQINSYFGRAESSVSIILELSYHNLSPLLKSCFLCLAFFKEDYIIPAERLINIWVGQGLIQKEGNRTIDEIGRGYLNELINRSMLRIENLKIDDQVQDCRLHDVLREVCLRKAKEEIGLEIVKWDEESSMESSCKPRHRVFYGNNILHQSSSLDRNKYLRSLFLFNVDSNVFMTTPSHYWKSFQLLKILELEGFAFPRLPRSFRSLIGLKCLRIHTHRSFEFTALELPIWLDELKNLEVLCMESNSVEFPNGALRMEKLRLFNVYSVFADNQMKIENWKNIESLKYIKLEDWIACSSELITGSCRLRELGIQIDENEGNGDEGMVRGLLEKMTNLVELHLLFFEGFPIEEIIPQLESLTKLELRCWAYGEVRFPAPSAFPPNLTHLTLARDIKPYGLKRVYPPEDWRMKISGDGFRCLKALCLRDFTTLRGVDIEEGGMPQLKHLKIHNCPNFQTDPNLPNHIIVSTA